MTCHVLLPRCPHPCAMPCPPRAAHAPPGFSMSPRPGASPGQDCRKIFGWILVLASNPPDAVANPPFSGLLHTGRSTTPAPAGPPGQTRPPKGQHRRYRHTGSRSTPAALPTRNTSRSPSTPRSPTYAPTPLPNPAGASCSSSPTTPPADQLLANLQESFLQVDVGSARLPASWLSFE
jgi:hypothetical protein